MGVGLVGKSNSQGRLHLESPFLWDEGGIVKEPSLCLTFESFPGVAAFPRELFNPHTPHPARQIRFLLAHPFSLSEEARSLNEARSVWRDLSRCVILDFFSKDACHFAIFWWKKKFPQIVLEIYEIKGRMKAISVKILSDRRLWLRKVRGTSFPLVILYYTACPSNWIMITLSAILGNSGLSSRFLFLSPQDPLKITLSPSDLKSLGRRETMVNLNIRLLYVDRWIWYYSLNFLLFSWWEFSFSDWVKHIFCIWSFNF